MYEIAKNYTKDGVYLHGLFKKGDKTKPAILHIHGYAGDFYSEDFIPVMGKDFGEKGYSFLSVETRGTGSEKKFSCTDGSNTMYGSDLELLSEAYLDIDCWIEYLVQHGYSSIILQGHSLGTMKIVRYLAEGSHINYVKKLVLLAPFDIHELAKIQTKGKYDHLLKKAKHMLAKGEGNTIVQDKEYCYQVSYQTLASWLTYDHFGRMFNFGDKENKFIMLNKIKIPVKVIVGKNDDKFHPINPLNPEEAIEIMKINIENFCYKIIEDCGHHFSKKEHTLTEEIIKFINETN